MSSSGITSSFDELDLAGPGVGVVAGLGDFEQFAELATQYRQPLPVAVDLGHAPAQQVLGVPARAAAAVFDLGKENES